MSSVREAFLDVARQLGLTTIFGNPGSTEETLLQALPADFDYVLVLQEAPAVSMADAYSRRLHQPVLVNLHTAAGMGNALAAIETAHYDQTPLIILAGQQTREMLLHEPYLINPAPHLIAAPFVKWSYETTRADDAPGALMRAYAAAVQAPAGPVFLSIPMDDFEQEYHGHTEVRTVTSMGADLQLLSPVVAALDQASAPALVIGGGVAHGDGWNSAIRLAERSHAKVWGAPLEGRLGFPETHAQFQGVLPTAMAPIAGELDGCDVVVVIGAPAFRYYPYVPGRVMPEGAALFHITDDPHDAAAAWTGNSFLADPARACAVLADALADTDRALPAPMPAATTPEAATPIPAAYLYATVQQIRPPDSVVVNESLSTQPLLHKHIPTANPDSHYAMTSGTLGFGLPAGVGVALAEKKLGSDRKVIAIIGDGSANYTLQALWTAVQHDANVLFVIPCNSAYTILKSFGDFLNTPDVPGLDLPGLDFVSLAAGYGMAAEKVDDPDDLAARLQAGCDRIGPYLIEVTVDPAVPPLIPPS